VTRRILTLLAAVVAMVLGSSASALADCHGIGTLSGAANANQGPGASYQNLQWDRNARTATVWASNTDEVLPSYCLDAAVDWITAAGHYDARIARNCDDTGTSTRGGTVNEPSGWGGRTVNGLQKAAGCYYEQTSPPYYSLCEYVPGSAAGCYFSTATAWNNYSHSTFLRRQDGSTQPWDGGLVQYPDQ
jgi:hypothetical protein